MCEISSLGFEAALINSFGQVPWHATIIAMDEELHLPPEPSRNPATHEAFRRQVWLQIYVPFVAGLLLLAGTAILLAGAALAGPSAWADASLILLLLPLIIFSVIPIVLLAFLVYGVSYLIGRIPVPAHQAQQAVAQAGRVIQQSAQRAAQPLILMKAGSAAAGSALNKLLSSFRRNG